MTYLDIENLLLRYGRWVRSGDGRVGYPRCAAFAVAIPADKDMAQAVTYFSRQPGVRQVLRDQIHPRDQQGIQ